MAGSCQLREVWEILGTDALLYGQAIAWFLSFEGIHMKIRHTNALAQLAVSALAGRSGSHSEEYW